MTTNQKTQPKAAFFGWILLVFKLQQIRRSETAVPINPPRFSSPFCAVAYDSIGVMSTYTPFFCGVVFSAGLLCARLPLRMIFETDCFSSVHKNQGVPFAFRFAVAVAPPVDFLLKPRKIDLPQAIYDSEDLCPDLFPKLQEVGK